MIAQSKARRTKKPIAPIHDKFGRMAEEIPTEPTTITMPEPVVTPKKSNAWILHVKSLAERKGIKFRDALRDPETKSTYKK